MDQVEKLCDSICLINKGKAVLAGKVREIKSSYKRDRVIVEFEGSSAFLESPEIAEVATTPATPRSASKTTATRKSSCMKPPPWPPSTASNSSSPPSKRSSSRPWEAKPMRNILLIAKREYLEQVRGRAFRLTTILVPLLFAASSA
jgi:ABC-type multidrug transport system ATPase subunit